jgi:hypothetical protein
MMAAGRDSKFRARVGRIQNHVGSNNSSSLLVLLFSQGGFPLTRNYVVTARSFSFFDKADKCEAARLTMIFARVFRLTLA